MQEILKGIHHVLSHTEHLVIVTNEIFSDGIEYDPETTRYQQYLGEMNCELAKLADVVVEVVYSIPLVKKGTLEELCHYEKKIWNSFLIAFAMFSKIPVPRADWDKENMRYMMCFFPLIGVVIGVLLQGLGISAPGSPLEIPCGELRLCCCLSW